MARAPYPDEVAFDAPLSVADGQGGTVDGFADKAEAFIARARIRYLRGGEVVQAARLMGRQPAVITIRFEAAAMDIRPDWRMRDTGAGITYNIRSGPVRSDDGLEIEFTAESGVAV